MARRFACRATTLAARRLWFANSAPGSAIWRAGRVETRTAPPLDKITRASLLTSAVHAACCPNGLTEAIRLTRPRAETPLTRMMRSRTRATPLQIGLTYLTRCFGLGPRLGRLADRVCDRRSRPDDSARRVRGCRRQRVSGVHSHCGIAGSPGACGTPTTCVRRYATPVPLGRQASGSQKSGMPEASAAASGGCQSGADTPVDDVAVSVGAAGVGLDQSCPVVAPTGEPQPDCDVHRLSEEIVSSSFERGFLVALLRATS